LPDVTWGENPYDIATNADAIVILTEWNEFRALQLERLQSLMKTPCMIDLRNIYKLPEMQVRGFHYVSVGRPEVKPESGVRLRSVS
jgi:UDPglucose 6-dehydrogenase